MTEPPTDGMTITRIFDAPRERVWQEWTEPERFADWFGGGEAEIPLSTVSMDVRPGGEFRSTMVHETDGTELPFAGSFREVVEPERLVQELRNPADPSDTNVETFTTTLEDLGDGKTEVTYHHFDRLAEQLART